MRKALMVLPLLLLASESRTETNAYDFEVITVTSSTPVGFSSGKLSPTNGPKPRSAFVTVETDDIRFRVDGTTPTVNYGHKVLSTSSGITISGPENVQHFKAIGVDNTCTLMVTYER